MFTTHEVIQGAGKEGKNNVILMNVILIKGRRFCENRQNRYRDNTRETKNRQNRIMMIPSRYWNRIGGDT